MAEINTLSSLLSAARGYYRMESGALTTDTKGSYTLTNTGTVGESTGKYTGAATTGTGNSTKKLGSNEALNCALGGEFSASFWMKPNESPSEGTWQQYLGHVAGTTENGCCWEFAYGQESGVYKLKYQIWVQPLFAAINSNLSGALSTSEWQHICLTDDGSKIYFYVNGSIVNTGGTSHNTGGETGWSNIGLRLFIANDFWPTGDRKYASGQLDDVAIFNRNLTAAEVLQIYTDPQVANRYSYSYFM